jgi:copper(I)-binding protein
MKNTKVASRRNIARLLLAGLALASGLALAQPASVSEPWARATVPGQKAAGVFMRLDSATGTRLVSVSSPVAAFGQVHEMRMEGDIMKMQALKNGLEVPVGKTVELKPGGYHIMLMDLKMPLQKDTTIPLALVFVDAKGLESRTELTVPVRAMGQMAPAQHTGHSQGAQK